MNAAVDMVALSAPVKKFVGQPRQALINGRWQNAQDGKTFEVFNPATEAVIAHVADCKKADVDLAVAAARKAFEEGPWPNMSPSARGKILWKIGDLILEHLEELAQLESLNNGKPIGVARGADVPLASHPGVDKVAFTGSTEVGKLIVKAAANDLKKVTLELGGKSPNIILDDADMSLAIPGASNAIFFNHGQCCCAGSRLFVQEKSYDQVLEGVSAAAKKIKLGPGLNPASEMGPLVSKVQFERVTGFLKSGRDEGARTVTGGQRHGETGFFVQPTVLDGTKDSMKVYKEEIFGPVVTVMPFKEVDDDIIRRANDSVYGLAAGLWTSNIQRAHRIANKLRAGTVWINCYNIFDASMPFGGYKQSGWGREMGQEVLKNYLETKSICMSI
jgi:phenylacetaldehyde dehydrogenase